MKIASFLTLAALAMLSSCGGQNKPAEVAEPVAEEEVKYDNMETREVGNLSITWIQDNKEARKMAADLFGTPEELVKELGAEEGFDASMSTFLVEADGKKILFDTGNGNEDSQLLPSLEKLSVSPEDIDVIAITHMHGDHIGGLMKGDEAVFPKAEIYMSQMEHDANVNTPDDKNAQQKKVVEAYKDRLHLFQFGDTIPGGFVALDCVGHTAGHTAFQNGELLIIGDLMHGAALQVNHPEYCARFDQDKDNSIANRKKYLDLARQNHLLLAGMHLPGGFLTLE